MSVPHSYYESPEMKRKLGPNWHKSPGCEHQPLFNISLQNIVIDELHLMLRITDRLEQGIVLEVLDWDEVIYTIQLNFTISNSQRKTVRNSGGLK